MAKTNFTFYLSSPFQSSCVQAQSGRCCRNHRSVTNMKVFSLCNGVAHWKILGLYGILENVYFK